MSRPLFPVPLSSPDLGSPAAVKHPLPLGDMHLTGRPPPRQKERGHCRTHAHLIACRRSCQHNKQTNKRKKTYKWTKERDIKGRLAGTCHRMRRYPESGGNRTQGCSMSKPVTQTVRHSAHATPSQDPLMTRLGMRALGYQNKQLWAYQKYLHSLVFFSPKVIRNTTGDSMNLNSDR